MAKIIGNTTATPMAIPDWNQTDEKKADYIKNKPNVVTEAVFNEEINKRPIAYDTRTTEPLTIEWDGNIEGHIVFDFVMNNTTVQCVKVSDVVPSYDELQNATFSFVASTNGLVFEHAIGENIMIKELSSDGQDGSSLMAVVDTASSEDFLYFFVAKESFALEAGTAIHGAGIYTVSHRLGFTNVIRFPSVATGELHQMSPHLIDGEIPYKKITSQPLTVTFNGNPDDYEQATHTSDDVIGYAIKLSNHVPTYEEILSGTIKMYNAGNITEIPLNIEESIVVDLHPDGTPIYQIGSFTYILVVTECCDYGHMVNLTPGIWMTGIDSIYIQEFYLPSITTEEIKKLSTEFIDAEWMATNTLSDLDIVLSAETAGSFESLQGMPMVSDIIPTIEQMKTGTFTLEQTSGVVQTMQITDDMIVRGLEGMPSDAYIVSDMLMVLGSQTTVEGITIPKGMYLGATIEDVLYQFACNSITLHVPHVKPVPNSLPEKFLSNKVVQAWKPIVEEIDIDFGLEVDETGYVTKESFDNFLESRWYGHDADSDTMNIYTIKLSDNIIEAESLKKITSLSWFDYQGLSYEQEVKFYDNGFWYGLGASEAMEEMPIIETFIPGIVVFKQSLAGTEYNGTYVVLWADLPTEEEGEDHGITDVPANHRAIMGPASFKCINTTEPGKKIDPELVDMDWYAGKMNNDTSAEEKLPEKYLPDTVATSSDVNSALWAAKNYTNSYISEVKQYTTKSFTEAKQHTDEAFAEAIAYTDERASCYDTRKTAPLTIEWDGAVDNRESIEIQADIELCKLSEIVPTFEEIQQGSGIFCYAETDVETVFADSPFTFAENIEEFQDNNGNIGWKIYSYDETVLLLIPNDMMLPADILYNEETPITKGIWSSCMFIHDADIIKEYFTRRVYFPSVATGELKTLDPKYLPDTVAYKSDIVPQVQADWNQTDSTKVDYIKHKPVVDQTYNALSMNAQSGIGVAEAIATKVSVRIDGTTLIIE